MACGTPVVSTSVGVMGELLLDGRAGRLVGFDAASLADGIQALLADEPARRAAGLAARQVASAFEYQRILEGYAKGLYSLVGREPLQRPEEAP